ncbi:uncharacterized protein [Cicer arietinum]|uniref:non-specific serine/threonine protein kinase n=1 Tax=Cicer arietinum TaxID=3827 RepID=A0A1S3EF52_CICAR|nr:probable serine/threonine-protein kinase SIS8 isoform X2 [Cicer arietinum]
MGGEKSENSPFHFLVNRCRSLEEKQAKLEKQFDELLQEKRRAVKDNDEIIADSTDGEFLSGFFFSLSPYASILKCMGHAVYVQRVSSGEIIYWNDSAETLYGWKDYEIIGQRVADFLVSEEYYGPLRKILERVITGVPWSGQFPFKKRSGEIMMAMVTKTPLYEDGELVGVISVSSDGAVFNSNKDFNKRRACQSRGNGQPGAQRFKRIQWPPRPLIAPVPQIASSVSNLETKCHSRSHHKENTTVQDTSKKDESTNEFSQPSKIAAKVLAKLQIGGSGKCRRNTSSINDNSRSYRVNNENGLSGGSVALTSHQDNSNGADKDENLQQYPFFKIRLTLEPEATNMVLEDEVQMRQEGLPLPCSKESIVVSRESSSRKGNSESNSIAGCGIHWEDLQLREEIGKGSCAVVYHGIWNASDVAIKLYFGNGYTEETLRDYKKEIDIMKRLRHPHVLLFMGAIYSQEKLAIVTELLPRGSLFKTLHKNNKKLDIRRRLKMALDVARGMNYLHHRNPPIVHRDLKSSNLLVDKNWTVKVGDFGLSRLKDATLLTTKSGRGTPQWMAPEVLRNEPSNEKSDVFSYGVVLWEIMTQSIPWENLNFLQVVGVVGFMDRRLDLPDELDPHVASIINGCWQSDPEQRPSFEELIQRMMLVLNRVTTMPLKRIAES